MRESLLLFVHFRLCRGPVPWKAYVNIFPARQLEWLIECAKLNCFTLGSLACYRVLSCCLAVLDSQARK